MHLMTNYSQYYGTCKHSKHSFFEKMGLPYSVYQVSKYIYAHVGAALRSSFGENSIDQFGLDSLPFERIQMI